MADQRGGIEEHSFHGHVVRTMGQKGHERLWIDGRRRKYFVTDDGFTLHDDAYAPPQKTLLEAVKRYCEAQPREKA